MSRRLLLLLIVAAALHGTAAWAQSPRASSFGAADPPDVDTSDALTGLRCDALASAPWDPAVPDRSATVDFRHLLPQPAIEACAKAVAAAPTQSRFVFQLGRAYDKARQNLAAYEAYKRAADLGSSSAMVNIAILFQKGQGVQTDMRAARDWWGRAAAAGNPEGMFCLATALDGGIGGEVDLTGAAGWYAKALNAGTRKAARPLKQIASSNRPTGTQCD